MLLLATRLLLLLRDLRLRLSGADTVSWPHPSCAVRGFGSSSTARCQGSPVRWSAPPTSFGTR